MTRLAYLAVLLLSFLAFVPPGRAAGTDEDNAPPRFETVRLDLEGVPRLRAHLPRGTLDPVRFEGPGGAPAWAVRLLAMPARLAPAARAVPQLQHVPTPAVERGRVIVGAGMGSTALYAFDARTGRKLWQVALGDNGPSTVAVSRGRAYTNTESCTTYGIDVETGRRTWTRLLGPNVMGAPTVAGDRVLAAANSGKPRHPYVLYALKADSGDVAWKTRLRADVHGAPVFAQGRVFLTTQDGTVSCLDQRGAIRWERRIGASSAPWADAGGLYVAIGREGAVTRLDARRGETVWTADPDRAASGGSGRSVTREEMERRRGTTLVAGWCADNPRPVVLGRSCLIAAGHDLRILDAGTGRETLRVRLPRGQTFHAPPAVLGDTLLYATRQGVLVQIHARTGAIRRVLDSGLPVSSQPVVANGRLFVVADGILLGIPWGERDDPDWPQWGGTATRSGEVVDEPGRATTPR